MKLIYQIQQTNQTKTNHIYLVRHFEFYKVDDKHYFIDYTVKDLFDCLYCHRSGRVSYSARHQRFLEREIKKGRYVGIEQFSDEDENLVFHENRW